MAIKIIRKENVKTKKDMERVRREIDILSVLRHPHIIKVIDGKLHSSYFKITRYSLSSSTNPAQLLLLLLNNNPPVTPYSSPVVETRTNIIIVMEYAVNGELFDYINERRYLDEAESRKYFRQIVSAVDYCHKVGRVSYSRSVLFP